VVVVKYMNRLEEMVDEPPWKEATAPLITIPIIATVSSCFITFYYEAEEPFGGVTYQDLGIMLLGPVLVFGLWVQWFWLARNYRLGVPVWGFMLVLALFTMLVASCDVPSFLRAPWTSYVPTGGRRPIAVFRTN
jgi:hypothetical protein